MSDSFDKIKKEEDALLCSTYARYPIAISRGQGSRLWDLDENSYIDLLAGIAVTSLGHCNPELCRVLETQAHKLWHVSNLFYQREQLDLARMLLSTSHHDKVFFCNSGAEANEAAIKLARRYMRKVKNRNASEIISLTGAFHGRTIATLAATGRETLWDGFTPLPDGFRQVPPNDLTALESAITPTTAAVLLECVQGEGGVIPLPFEYLAAVEKVCRKHDILLICDEVQCGLCRTGKFWAFQHADIHPDIISAAKALANGLPMGAILATKEVAAGFIPGSHATTFGGTPLVSAVACEVINIMLRDSLAERAAQLGSRLKEKLKGIQERHPGKVQETRGLGLMLGVEIGEKAPEVWRELLHRGFICNLSHNRTLRLLPPLTISWEELESFADTLESILEHI